MADSHIDYNDKRLTSITADANKAVSDINADYTKRINDSNATFAAAADKVETATEELKQIQQENTDFTIKKIEQSKEQAKKDYIKEQSAAYADWQKQSNPYGVNAEKMAESGLWGSGYSESAKVSMYNTYQNRVALAKESYDRAILTFDNSIMEARLQNSAAMAELALNTLEKTLELTLQGMQYSNQLLSEKANLLFQTQQLYDSRYQNMLGQMNTEAAFKETQRMNDEELKLARRQMDLDEKKYDLVTGQADNPIIEKGGGWMTDMLGNLKGGLFGSAKSGSTAQNAGSATISTKSTGTKKSGIPQEQIDWISFYKLGYPQDLEMSPEEINKMVDIGAIVPKRGNNGKYTFTAGTAKPQIDKIDWESVQNLGYGPLTYLQLKDLLDRNLVGMSEENGKITFGNKLYTKKGAALAAAAGNLG